MVTSRCRRFAAMGSSGISGPGLASRTKGFPGEIISYYAMDKTAPNMPNSGFEAVMLAAKSQYDSKKGTYDSRGDFPI